MFSKVQHSEKYSECGPTFLFPSDGHPWRHLNSEAYTLYNLKISNIIQYLLYNF